MSKPTPVTHQVRLLARLKELRLDREESLRAVGEALDWSEAKMSRIESGAVRLTVSDLRVLTEHYGVAEPERSELIEWTRASREHEWWDNYRPFYSPDFIRFVGIEASAGRVRQFQLLRIPGLLQTEEYTIAVATRPDVSDESVRRETEIRSRRQEGLDNEDVLFEFVLDEALLHRRVSGKPAWRRQLAHLDKMISSHPNVTIRVFPFSAGLVPGMGNSFELFDLVAGTADAVLIEQLERDSLIVGNDARITSFSEVFDQLWNLALTREESQKRIREVLDTSDR